MKFYTDLSRFNVKNIDRNVFDLIQTHFFVCLLPIALKKQFLSEINEESQSVFRNILNIEQEFVTNIEDCDYVLLPPFNFWSPLDVVMSENNYFEYIDHIHNTYGKKIVIFYSGPDDDRVIDVDPNKIVMFRAGSYKESHQNKVFGLPTFAKDAYRGSILEKKLSLSYCGYPGSNGLRNFVLEEMVKFDYSDFIFRNCWCNMQDYLDNDTYDSLSVVVPEESKTEYIDNLQRNLYGLVIRGSTNYCHRLSEVFMMGRIPVLFNTDRILPFEDFIDYEKCTVYIEDQYCDDIDYVNKKIQLHYDSHTEQELIELQKKNRKIWEQYFTVDGAFFNIIKILKTV